ncbi:MAG: type IV toxin-antitoxin system AbiEi family antitoxin domain-containing protein [Solirubrobacterales bacterium]|nr:type IV toxin-antitoxin system AbiEi family antitoxin domain-containing protein [Solirubrobacterales bacterium]
MAARQHGVVATWQLTALGLTYGDIHYRASIGRLHRIHRGVYAVGYRKLTPYGHRMAAVLAYGPDAVISHQTAAANWGIGQPSYKIHVTTPKSKHSRPGIRAHTASLHPEDIDTHNGIPTTSVARTILDLAAHRDETGLTNLIEDADRNELIDGRALAKAITRRPKTAGIPRLRAVLADYRGPADTRSKLERGFRALITKERLPEPQYNVIVAGVEADVYWPQWRLVVELDSRRYHLTFTAFERDRIRDTALQKARVRVLRVTDKRFDNDQPGVLADIIALSRTA